MALEFYPIYESSPQLEAFNKAEPRRTNNFPKSKIRLPLGYMEVGYSFVIPLNECNFNSLTALLSYRKTKCKEDYVMFVHYDSNVVEVGRLK
jgi:hypothetical protein